MEETILTYTNAWNETERTAILEKIKKCWAPDATFTDRLTDTIKGWDAITDLIIKFVPADGAKNVHGAGVARHAPQQRPLQLACGTPGGISCSGHGLF